MLAYSFDRISSKVSLQAIPLEVAQLYSTFNEESLNGKPSQTLDKQNSLLSFLSPF